MVVEAGHQESEETEMTIPVLDDHRTMTITRIHLYDWNEQKVQCDIEEGNIHWLRVWLPMDKVYVNPMEVIL